MLWHLEAIELIHGNLVITTIGMVSFTFLEVFSLASGKVE
jgi:hypothetical protein